MKHLLLILSLMAIPMTALSGADDRLVFYQPQLDDQQLDREQWQSILGALDDAGYSGVVFQWTRYNEEHFGGVEGWLGQRVEDAVEAGLEIWVGLHWEDRWFASLERDSQSWGDELNELLLGSLAQARTWQDHPRYEAFAGWYLPLELPDRGLAETGRQTILSGQLGRLLQALDSPLAVSSYFTGRQQPRQYAEWLHGLNDLPGLRVWVQDGAGVGQLTGRERRHYLDELDCDIGIIHEAFEQLSAPDAEFEARPRPLSENQFDGCHPSLVFSLRYLPAGELLLQHGQP